MAPPSDSVRLVALDLDGTLLRTDKTISSGNRAAVRRCLDAGLQVVLASGRMHYATAKYADQLGLPGDAYIISYSGGMGRQAHGEQPLFERPLDADKAEWMVRFAQDGSYHLNYYLGDVLYTPRPDQWSELYQKRTGCAAEFVGSLDRFAGRRPTKLVLIDDGAKVAELVPRIREHYGDAAQVVVTDDEYLEVQASDANKGLALATVAGRLGVAAENCLAVGDGNNDLSMLSWVGRPVVMANGREALLERFPVHAPANDDDGVAHVLNNLLDNMRRS